MRVKKHLLALLIGLAVGILTVLGQKYLPDSVNNFANSGAVWLVPAFLVSYWGGHGRVDSICAGILALLGCVLGYYGFEAVMNAHALSMNRWVMVWTAMAFVGGAVFGYGAYIANNGKGIWRYIGLNLLPAVFIAESASKFLHFSDYSHLLISMVLSIAIGVVLYFVINLKQAIRIKNLAALLSLTVLGTGLFEVLYFIG